MLTPSGVEYGKAGKQGKITNVCKNLPNCLKQKKTKDDIHKLYKVIKIPKWSLEQAYNLQSKTLCEGINVVVIFEGFLCFTETPEASIEGNTSLVVIAGQEVTLVCQVTGRPIPSNIQWENDGSAVNESIATVSSKGPVGMTISHVSAY